MYSMSTQDLSLISILILKQTLNGVCSTAQRLASREKSLQSIQKPFICYTFSRTRQTDWQTQSSIKFGRLSTLCTVEVQSRHLKSIFVVQGFNTVIPGARNSPLPVNRVCEWPALACQSCLSENMLSIPEKKMGGVASLIGELNILTGFRKSF